LACLPFVATGFFAASVLAIAHLLQLPVPCGASDDCARVAADPASLILGFPLAGIGVVAYALLAFLLGSPRRRARTAFAAVAVCGAAVGLSLLAHSITDLDAVCTWCGVSTLCMTSLAALGALRMRTPATTVSPNWFFGTALAASLAVGVQGGLIVRTANAPPIPAEALAGLSVADLVDHDKAVGPDDAAVTVVVFGDLWCPGCRTALASLAAFRASHADRVRIAYRHRPLLHVRGHETSGAAAALSEIAAEEGRFGVFADAVHALTGPPDREGYLQLVAALGIASRDAESRIADPRDPAVRRVWRDVELADRLGVTVTPTFVVLVVGRAPISADQRKLPLILGSRPVRDVLARPR
jgi:protein-disulfide isomerase